MLLVSILVSEIRDISIKRRSLKNGTKHTFWGAQRQYMEKGTGPVKMGRMGTLIYILKWIISDYEININFL